VVPGHRTGGGASSAGASAWARYRTLALEHRPERLALRLVLGAAAGVVAAGVAGWKAAPVAAAVVMLGHVLFLRHKPGPVTSWRQGALAERSTGRRLARLDPALFHVLHDRAVPDSPATNIDHLVIGRTGVYLVISRRWARTARLWADHRRLWVGRRPMTVLPAAAARLAGTVADLLSAELGQDIEVTALVAVHGARLPRNGLRHRGVTFQKAGRLARYVEGGAEVFTSAQVATIAAAAERTLPPMLGSSAHGARPIRR
jgi:nuclease-like protein